MAPPLRLPQAAGTPARSLLLFPLILSVAACAFVIARASDAPPTTVFKPTAARFVAKRTTVDLSDALAAAVEGAAAAAAASAAPANWTARRARTVPRGQARPRGSRRLGANTITNGTASKISNKNNNDNIIGSSPTASVRRSWRGLNAFEQAAAVGNPQHIERDPPDLGLAVGNGYVMSSVNSALRIYDAKTGAPLVDPSYLTVLYGLPPSNDDDGQCNAELVDPTTLYDSDTRRWFQIAFRAERDPASCAWTGAFFVEVAVSATASPLGRWSTYSIYASNDGRFGSPLLPGCEGGCLPDYPMANVNDDALVITVNSFTLQDDAAQKKGVGAEEHGGEQTGPQAGIVVFAIDKAALARGAKKVAVAEFAETTAGAWDDDELMFTLSPAYTPPLGSGKKEKGHGKKKGQSDDSPFLLLSHSLANGQRLLRFALTGTRALWLATTPTRLQALKTALTLTASPVMLPEPLDTNLIYSFPQPLEGNFPYGQSEGRTEPMVFGSLDSRMLSTVVAQGRQLGVFHSLAEQEGGSSYLAIYLVQLDAKTGALLQLDVLSEPGTEMAVPAIAVNSKGKGAIVCTATSLDLGRYLSVAAYPLSITPSYGAIGALQIVLEGKGLADNFDGRLGDYSAATIEHETGLFWGAAEWISRMSCPLVIWENVDDTCGQTRAPETNWDTGIVALKV